MFLYLLLLGFAVVKFNVAAAFVIANNRQRNTASETTKTTTAILQSTSSAYSSILDNSNCGDDDNQEAIKLGISIEYCSECKWMLRSIWTAQELLTTTFIDGGKEIIDSVTLIPIRSPPNQGGVFNVAVTTIRVVNQDSAGAKKNESTIINNKDKSDDDDDDVLNKVVIAWNRKKEEELFPESDLLKQRIRDIIITPDQFLVHSSDHGKSRKENTKGQKEKKTLPSSQPPTSYFAGRGCSSIESSPMPNVEIHYCSSHEGGNNGTSYGHLLRAAWLAQELLTTFDKDDGINSVSLVPTRSSTDNGTGSDQSLSSQGVLIVYLDKQMIWDDSCETNKDCRLFADFKAIEQRVRDKLVSDHNDDNYSNGSSNNNDIETAPEVSKNEVIDEEEMDDDQAEDMRKFFGVM